MENATKLDDVEIQRRLSGLPGWAIKEGKLYREIIFENFIEAFGFMTKVAIAADAVDHHPEWSNVYKTVRIQLSTHEVGGVSDRDFSLATKINSLLR